jgi:DNA-binding MarR family transcriptional regulator
MGRFDRPGALGTHLSEVAGVWKEVFGDLDATGIELFGRLDAVARNWAALCREVLTPFGINYAELTTLGILRTTRPRPRRSPTELRRLVGQTSAGMTRILDKLEVEGLVKRESLRGDGRRVDIVLSRRGASLAEKAFHELLVRQNEIYVSLAASKARITSESLDTLLDEFAEVKRRAEESRLNEIA